MKHFLTTAVVTAAACLHVACSNFERDWGRAVRGGPARPVPSALEASPLPPEGAWAGTWRSEKTGHSGELRCLVVRPRDPEVRGGLWSFRYHARWGMLSGEFKTWQPVDSGPRGALVSKGKWTVPQWAGGTYDYEIEVTNADLRGKFQGSGDHGTFSMKRPAQP